MPFCVLAEHDSLLGFRTGADPRTSWTYRIPFGTQGNQKGARAGVQLAVSAEGILWATAGESSDVKEASVRATGISRRAAPDGAPFSSPRALC